MEISVYKSGSLGELEIYEAENCSILNSVAQSDKVWIDIETEDPVDFQPIADKYKLHELAVEDCFTRGHFPKIEEYAGYTFIMLRGLKSISDIEEIRADEDFEEEYNSEKLTRGVAIFISETFIITHRLGEVSWLDAVLRQIKQYPEQIKEFNTQEITLRIADVLTIRFLRGMNYFEDQIESAEDLVIENHDDFDMHDILEIKRDLNILTSIMRDQKTIFARLSTEPSLIKTRQLRRYFKNIDDRASTILQNTQRLLDNLASVRDVYFAMSNVRLGDIMRILAVITTIAAPLHLVVGLYGMNFEAIPFLHDKYGFWLIVILMLSLVLVMLTFFRKRNWI